MDHFPHACYHLHKDAEIKMRFLLDSEGVPNALIVTCRLILFYPNTQVNEEIIHKSSQCKEEKELDWDPLPMNLSFNTDMHELQPILDEICMDLEPTLIKYIGSNSCLDTEEVKLLKACFSLK